MYKVNYRKEHHVAKPVSQAEEKEETPPAEEEKKVEEKPAENEKAKVRQSTGVYNMQMLKWRGLV